MLSVPRSLRVGQAGSGSRFGTAERKKSERNQRRESEKAAAAGRWGKSLVSHKQKKHAFICELHGGHLPICFFVMLDDDSLSICEIPSAIPDQVSPETDSYAHTERSH